MVELQFLYKSLRLTLYLTLLFGAFLIYYFGLNFGLGFISASGWNVLNFSILTGLVRAIFQTPKPKPKASKVVLFFFLKFGLLYGAGFVIIKYSHFSLWGILSGFSLLFMVLFLRALGKIFYERISRISRSGNS